MPNNVIKFPNTRVFTLKFKVPDVMVMNSDEEFNISLEVCDGIGTAQVRAKNVKEARRRLHKYMPIHEWLEEWYKNYLKS